jgi:hypothetical protein
MPSKKPKYWEADILHEDKSRIVLGVRHFDPLTKEPYQPMILELNADYFTGGGRQKRSPHGKKLERI